MFLSHICFTQTKNETYLYNTFKEPVYADMVNNNNLQKKFKDSVDVFVTDWSTGYYYQYFNKTYTDCIDIIFSRFEKLFSEKQYSFSYNKDGDWGKIDENDVTLTYTIIDDEEWDHRLQFYFWNNKITGIKIDVEGIENNNGL